MRTAKETQRAILNASWGLPGHPHLSGAPLDAGVFPVTNKCHFYDIPTTKKCDQLLRPLGRCLARLAGHFVDFAWFSLFSHAYGCTRFIQYVFFTLKQAESVAFKNVSDSGSSASESAEDCTSHEECITQLLIWKLGGRGLYLLKESIPGGSTLALWW